MISRDISEKCSNALSEMGYKIKKLMPFSKLQTAVSCHADMLLFYDGKEIVTHKEYYEQNKELFDSLNIELVLSDEDIRSNYPNDILFNALLSHSGVLFSNTEYTSKFVVAKAVKTVSVKQGYTACSVCKVADRAYITTDNGLYEAFIKNNIDSLLIEKEGIVLPGYDCGFIGGASAVIGSKVCFFGDLSRHKDHDRIVSFIEKYGRSAVSLSDEKLTDIGGAVVINN